MLLLLAILLGSVVAGLLLGGSLSRLGTIKLGWWPLIFVALAFQVAPVPSGPNARYIEMGLLLGSYALLLSVASCNIRKAGFALITVGLLMNVAVIALNGGMPVSRTAVIAAGGDGEVITDLDEGTDGDPKHQLVSDDTKLTLLADVIPVGSPFSVVVSAGDLVFYAGMAWFVMATMLGRSNRPLEPRIPNAASPPDPEDAPPESPPPPPAP